MEHCLTHLIVEIAECGVVGKYLTNTFKRTVDEVAKLIRLQLRERGCKSPPSPPLKNNTIYGIIIYEGIP